MTKAESRRSKYEKRIRIPLVFTSSMSPSEAQMRKIASTQVDGVKFTKITLADFAAQGGDPIMVPAGRVVGITVAGSLESLKKYNLILNALKMKTQPDNPPLTDEEQ